MGSRPCRDPYSRAPSAYISPCLLTVAARLPVEQAMTQSECCCTDEDGEPTFDDLHSRVTDHAAFSYAFDLLLIEATTSVAHR